MAAGRRLPIDQATLAVDFTDRINIANELIASCESPGDFQLEVFLGIAYRNPLLPHELLDQMNSLGRSRSQDSPLRYSKEASRKAPYSLYNVAVQSSPSRSSGRRPWPLGCLSPASRRDSGSDSCGGSADTG
jgi:hypothetical protein